MQISAVRSEIYGASAAITQDAAFFVYCYFGLRFFPRRFFRPGSVAIRRALSSTISFRQGLTSNDELVNLSDHQRFSETLEARCCWRSSGGSALSVPRMSCIIDSDAVRCPAEASGASQT